MKSSIWFWLLGMFCIAVGCKAEPKGFHTDDVPTKVIEFKVAPPKDEMSATPALREAIAKATSASQDERAQVVILLERGVYPLDAVPEGAGTILAVHGANHLTIKGAGEETILLVRDNMPNADGYLRKVIAVHGCVEFSMRDLTIDFAPSARDWLQGIARNVRLTETGETVFDLELDEHSPPFREGIFATESSWCVGIALNDHDQPREDMPDYFSVTTVRQDAGHLLVTMAVMDGVDIHAFLQNQRVVLARRKPGEALFCFSGINQHPELKNVVIHASRGMMIEAYGCNRLELDHFRMERAPGQWFVSPGDGVHYQGGVSGPYVHDSHFEGLGDDAIHIYAKPFVVMGESEADRVQCATDGLSVGDRLWVYAHESPGDGRLLKVMEAADGEVRLDAPVPAGLTPNRAINLDRSGIGFEIRNNTFGPLRGMGCRIQTGMGVIEGNTFTRVGAVGISFESGMGENYDEGPFPYDVTVKGNRFVHTGSSAGYGWQGIRRNVRWNPFAPNHDLAFRNILLEGNVGEEGTTVITGW